LPSQLRTLQALTQLKALTQSRARQGLKALTLIDGLKERRAARAAQVSSPHPPIRPGDTRIAA
jgi:hypothetical protein